MADRPGRCAARDQRGKPHRSLVILFYIAAIFLSALLLFSPTGLLGGLGPLTFAVGPARLALLGEHPTPFDVIWRMALAGCGFGLFQTPNNRTMIAAAPRERAGGASSMLGTARLLGQTTGAALAALSLARYPAEGTQLALLAAVGFALLGAGLSTLRPSEAGARGAEHVRVHDSQRLRGN